MQSMQVPHLRRFGGFYSSPLPARKLPSANLIAPFWVQVPTFRSRSITNLLVRLSETVFPVTQEGFLDLGPQGYKNWLTASFQRA